MISIIIPLYNVEKYIINCLASFENQIYKTFELIIVNDGSTDQSAKIVKSYIRSSILDIKLIEQKNSGVSAARNLGIRNAKGDYLCFVDSDDMVTPYYLSEMYELIKKYQYNVVICNYKHIKDDYTSNLITINESKVKDMKNYEALVKFLYRDIRPGVWSLMMRSNIIKGGQLLFAEGYRYSEDIEFIYKLLFYSKKVGYLDRPLYLYRTRNTSVMSLVDDKRVDGLKLMQGLETFFENKNTTFAIKYKRFGVARWAWATIWQVASASENYNEFKKNSRIYGPRKNMKALIRFPRFKVAIFALIYMISPLIYYMLIKAIQKKNNRRFINLE